jgi:hypothetical protein
VDTWSSPDCIPDFTLTIAECPAGGACCHPDETCTDVGSAAECADNYQGDGTACATTICPPGNDHCEDAEPISIGGTATGNTGGADDDTQDYCGTGSVNQGVWFVVTGNGNELTASLCNSDYDTKIQVWTDCAATGCVGGNDDDCDGKGLVGRKEEFAPDKGGGRALQSSFTWVSTVGVEYYIHVGGYGSSTGNYELEIIDATPLPVPTVSEWGLVFLTLVGLCAAMIVLRRLRAEGAVA